MDFVDWCSLVLNRFIEVSRSDPHAWHVGIGLNPISEHFFNCSFHSMGSSPRSQAIVDATYELLDIGFLTYKDKNLHTYEVTQRGTEAVDDPILFWEYICSKKLHPEQQDLLKAVNGLSEKIESDFAFLERVTTADILSALGWTKEQLWSVAKPLENNLGFLSSKGSAIGNFVLHSTYPGLVWATRRGITLESKRIDALVKTWETTSIDFKQELHLDTADQKAEFVKDILGLVNTQSSPPRLLIIGFVDKTRSYYGPPDTNLSQNRIEHILADLTSPVVNVRYETVHYSSGLIGQIEIIREAEKLPYRVAEGIGFKGKGGRRIEKDQIFVRHGSQTEEPTAKELELIIAEGDRARSSP
jgi:hypothetical protein